MDIITPETKTLNPDTPATTTRKQVADLLISSGVASDMNTWKLADWVEWFGGHLVDAWSNAQDQAQHAEYQVGRLGVMVMDKTAANYNLCYGAPVVEELNDEHMEESECFLRNHIHLLHHRALLQRIAPFYWWSQGRGDLTDEQTTAFANEFMVALMEAGSDMMREIFHTKYSRDAMLDYMMGEDEAE